MYFEITRDICAGFKVYGSSVEQIQDWIDFIEDYHLLGDGALGDAISNCEDALYNNEIPKAAPNPDFNNDFDLWPEVIRDFLTLLDEYTFSDSSMTPIPGVWGSAIQEEYNYILINLKNEKFYALKPNYFWSNDYNFKTYNNVILWLEKRGTLSQRKNWLSCAEEIDADYFEECRCWGENEIGNID